MKRNRIHGKPARVGDFDLLFNPRLCGDGFTAFYDGVSRRGALDAPDDIASAYRLYLYLGEIRNRR